MVPFSQLRTSTDALSGTGLGLPLTDAMVKAHGGTLKLTSQGLGLGTTATIVLPVKCRPSGEAEAAEPDLTWLKAGGGRTRVGSDRGLLPIGRGRESLFVAGVPACYVARHVSAPSSDVDRFGFGMAQANPAADVDILCFFSVFVLCCFVFFCGAGQPGSGRGRPLR